VSNTAHADASFMSLYTVTCCWASPSFPASSEASLETSVAASFVAASSLASGAGSSPMPKTASHDASAAQEIVTRRRSRLMMGTEAPHEQLSCHRSAARNSTLQHGGDRSPAATCVDTRVIRSPGDTAACPERPSEP